uniref:Glycosyltransferase 2-like domain-containing protein n=1 Tax=viral metagenome TaxID=1070528 RepID=A0A6C0BP48_9ZZZZ
MKPKFSIVTLTRNESQRILKIAATLEEFLKSGGDWVVADSASTDGTTEMAEMLGATVCQLGETYRKVITPEMALEITTQLDIPHEERQIYFHFSGARNAAARKALHDHILVLDAGDLVEAMNIAKINQTLSDGGLFPIVHYLGYGNKHSSVRFYDRRRWHYMNRAHEYLALKPDRKQGPRVSIAEEDLKVVYIRQQTKPRTYLAPMYFDLKENPQSHRCHFYLARRLYYNKCWAAAIKVFEKGLSTTQGWYPEMSQAAVYCGMCYVHLKKLEDAKSCYIKAVEYDASRREPWLRLGYIAQAKGQWALLRGYMAAMLVTPQNISLYENGANYGILPHNLMYVACVKLGDYKGGYDHWKLCLRAQPGNSVYQADAKYFTAQLQEDADAPTPPTTTEKTKEDTKQGPRKKKKKRRRRRGRKR